MLNYRPFVAKYSTTGPRYTSYPTAPHWSDAITESEYRRALSRMAEDTSGETALALYVHIPFCEALCYYCGCNIQITKDHDRAKPYLDALRRELKELRALLGSKKSLSLSSWGGGTPTFLSVSEIESLHQAITESFSFESDAEVSIEVDPRVTTGEHLRALRRVGFNRLSLGVQDFNEEVQKVVNRVQSASDTRKMFEDAKTLGFQGVNFDFIYGLPLQTMDSFRRTVDEIMAIRPDRIALYNYAHLPSLRPHQKIMEKYPMPGPDERIRIFTMAYDRLVEAGYVAIGMDHFALPGDELAEALHENRLYRNFMGYTVKKGTDLLGVGASAISELKEAYFQNVRETKSYEDRVTETGLATMRGCQLSLDDRRRKWAIQRIMCQFEIPLQAYHEVFGNEFWRDFDRERQLLSSFEEEGMVEVADDEFRVTPLGRLFVRNIAMLFDSYLGGSQPSRYSATV